MNKLELYSQIIKGCVRNELEDFHATSGTGELSQDDMSKLHIELPPSIGEYLKGDSPITTDGLFDVVIKSLEWAYNKVQDKEEFISCIRSGIKLGYELMNELESNKKLMKRFIDEH